MLLLFCCLPLSLNVIAGLGGSKNGIASLAYAGQSIVLQDGYPDQVRA
ncbi:chaperonin GroEL [Nitrobacter sp. Nb-311A]|nr:MULTISPECIES: hypothetical protein [unclassified Nitrobacter]EAQ36541.1 chaperonin GroEL [Nitrobacter sp. Nb-311A]MCB1392732.1 hypothetical protein [Nitrobacter sp.]MCV0385606.1 hypothetical protein [Nitrobacter sp.]